MVDKRTAQELLEGAYTVQSPDDNVSYYKDFAAVYDAGFAATLGYVYPKIIADTYLANRQENDVPVADVGCGTGLVAEQLALPRAQIEGLDISADMLDVARGKHLYGALHMVDLTRPLDMAKGHFGAVVSAGTFTHGHLGPDPLINLLPIARAGALFCIGVNEQHFVSRGFAATLKGMEDRRDISRPVIQAVDVYAKKDHAHGDDRALVVIFHKR